MMSVSCDMYEHKTSLGSHFIRRMEEAEEPVLRRRLIVVVPCVLSEMLCFGCHDNSLRQELRETSAPTAIKQPMNFSQRTFDPAQPPSDMPPLSRGEEAVCDSDF